MTITPFLRRFLPLAASFLAGIMTLAAIATLTLDSRLPDLSKQVAAVTTVEWLTQICQNCGTDPCTDPAGIMCNGYILGVIDSHPPGITGPCFPEELKVEATRTLFLSWSLAHPNARKLPAASGLIDMLNQDFNCRAGGSV
jgi:hypothetical protein